MTITVLCTYVTVSYGIGSLSGVVLIIVVAVTAYSTASLFFPAFGFMKKIYPCIRIRLFDYFYDKEYKKVEPQIAILTGERSNYVN